MAHNGVAREEEVGDILINATMAEDPAVYYTEG